MRIIRVAEILVGGVARTRRTETEGTLADKAGAIHEAEGVALDLQARQGQVLFEGP